ncbi:MAG: hypothetical protein A2508_10205 [Candidatus Lambdaproteobacteria bacterium RIFOXYD12_FULL_49_8]|uniref:Alginate export domain-containing protein n=1 Tax=Candidatus Lambdaproteobacteria bacterium RIFOXYD2_FULL_50_16 TaxID=1817772 RepID=A0A1F6GBN8_9PROT|nr:MAG: hypothetical protein A2527_06810 [Candidatus Lambdaproteobacteria bacterium RIFOXYD2_FULL_50_16]OGG97890.1 MAG: hypothetical protein A2508_10205 [Candidatus Lambdaproteobacteria bacterium RIFOXYD12_FULL_49_8]
MNFLKLHKALVLGLGLFFAPLDLVAEDLDLEQAPVQEAEAPAWSENQPVSEPHWEEFYLKASYRYYYRLKIRYSDDRWSIPFNNSLQTREESVETRHIYGADSKIQVAKTLSSYLRFDYYFRQRWDQLGGKYQDSPEVNLYEAYLDYTPGTWSARIGGQQMRLGKIDFDSPLDVLNLKDQDKQYHLDPEDQALIMPAGIIKKSLGELDWKLYWGPFQRVSEEATSLRANFGLMASQAQGALHWDAGLFRWPDPDNRIDLTFVSTAINPLPKPTLTLTDAPMTLVFYDFEWAQGAGLFKGDFAYFGHKTVYSILLSEKNGTIGEDSKLESLSLPQAALALSFERQWGDFFWMPSYSYKSLIQVPQASLIYQFENGQGLAQQERNLERHQVMMALAFRPNDHLKFGALGFVSAPYNRQGWALESSDQILAQGFEWILRLSHTGTEVDQSTGRATELSRLEGSLKFWF